MDKKMMICSEGHPDCLCGHKYKHPIDESCSMKKCSEPLKCIPYVEPSPKDKCPECGHEISDHKSTGCWKYDFDKGYCGCGKPFNSKPQPEPMPLIDVEWLKVTTWRCPKCNQLSNIDLTAHDQQVRKDLIEEVCKLLDDELRIISPNTEAKLKAHIRAMAGER
jgi:hypothetical protein